MSAYDGLELLALLAALGWSLRVAWSSFGPRWRAFRQGPLARKPACGSACQACVPKA